MRKLAVIALLVVGASGMSAAAEEGKTLKDRIKSVSDRLYGKGGRMELTLYPMSSISLNDAFYRKFGGGLGIAYHLSEAFGLQVMGTYSLNLSTGYASYHGGPEENTEIPYAGKRTFLVAADFCWSPIYGKISLAAESTMHFDTYLIAGFGAIGGEQENERNMGFAGTFGVGARVFFSRTFALKLELKDFMIFNDKVSYSGLPPKSDVQHQLLLNVGLSMFFLEGSEED